MASVSPPHQWPRGPRIKLHEAAFYGSTERLLALLSDGSIDVDQGNPQFWGCTPLMMASMQGHSSAVRILLNKSANLSKEADNGFTALHCSAEGGHLAVTKMLVEARADLEAATDAGDTPLHLAAERGHHEVMSVLIEAGANPNNSRRLARATPLFMAAQNGHKDAVKVLLRGKANPLLTRTNPKSGVLAVPLDIAAQSGHFEVVRELVQQVGAEGCGGASGGFNALRLAATNQHVDVMSVLADAGVVDDGTALAAAAARGRELSIKFLLQQRRNDEAAYVNYDMDGVTPLLCAMSFLGVSSPSPRITRLLIDAGADATSAVRVTKNNGEVGYHETPLDLATVMLREKGIAGKDATEEQLNKLEGIRRLLLRVEAVHAVSFLWPVDVPSIVGTAEGTSSKVAASTPLRMMLPILRRRARRPRVLLGALFRLVRLN